MFQNSFFVSKITLFFISLNIIINTSSMDRSSQQSDTQSSYKTIDSNGVETYHFPDVITFAPQTISESLKDVQSDKDFQVATDNHSANKNQNSGISWAEDSLYHIIAPLKEEVSNHETNSSTLKSSKFSNNSKKFNSQDFVQEANSVRELLKKNNIVKKELTTCPSDCNKEKINKTLESISGFLDESYTYKGYLNFVETLLSLNSKNFKENEYEFAYFKSSVFNLFFNKDGELKTINSGIFGNELHEQILIYLKNTLTDREIQFVYQYFSKQDCSFLVGKVGIRNKHIKDFHPGMGIFSGFSKSSYINHSREFGEKISSHPVNYNLLRFIRHLKAEALNNDQWELQKAKELLSNNFANTSSYYFSNFSTSKLSLWAQNILEKRNKAIPNCCLYDPQLDKISIDRAIQRCMKVLDLIERSQIEPSKLNVFLIKALYEITDKNAPKEYLGTLLQLFSDGNHEVALKLCNLEQIYKDNIHVKRATEYLKLASSLKSLGFTPSTNFLEKSSEVKILVDGINQSLNKPNADKTILYCSDFLKYPGEITDAQAKNKNKIISLASNACKQIYSESNQNQSESIKQLKLADFLHIQNQDAKKAELLNDNIKILADILINKSENSDQEIRTIQKKLIDNAFEIAEFAFDIKDKNIQTLDFINTSAININFEGLAAISKAKAFSGSSGSNNNSSQVTQKIQELKNLSNNYLSDLEFSKNLVSKYCKFTDPEYLNSQDSLQAKFLNKEFCKTLDKIAEICSEYKLPATDLRINTALKLNALGFDYTEQSKFSKAYKTLDVLDSLINFTVGFFRTPAMGFISSIEAAGKLAYNMLDIIVQEEMDHEKLLATGFAFGFNSPEYLKECQKIYDVNKQQADKVLAVTNAALETGKIIGKAVLDHEIVNKIGLMYGFCSPEFVQAEQQFSVQNKVFNEAVKSFADKVKNMDAGQLGGLSGELFFTFAPYGKIGKILSPLLQESATALKNLGNVSLGKIEMIAEALNTEKQFVVLGTALTEQLTVLSSAINETEKALPAIQKVAEKIDEYICKCPPEYLSQRRGKAHKYFMQEVDKLGHITDEGVKQLSLHMKQSYNDRCLIYNLPEIQINHIFKPGIKCDGKELELVGFHHDYMGHIKKSGVLEFKNIIEGPAGTWEAKVYYKGFNKTCSFFPDTWSRERVVESIHESLQNLKEFPTIQKNGTILFKGVVKINDELIEIHTVIDNSNIIRSAYPSIGDLK